MVLASTPYFKYLQNYGKALIFMAGYCPSKKTILPRERLFTALAVKTACRHFAQYRQR